jgi:hypothetical protein
MSKGSDTIKMVTNSVTNPDPDLFGQSGYGLFLRPDLSLIQSLGYKIEKKYR